MEQLNDRYSMKNLHRHDVMTHRWATLLGGLLFLLGATFFALGFWVWHNNFIMAIALLHGLVTPFVYPRNLSLALDFRYYGKVKTTLIWEFIKHGIVLTMIEVSLIGTSVPFIAHISILWVSIAMAIFLSLVLFLVAERDTYYHVRRGLAIDQRLTIHKEE